MTAEPDLSSDCGCGCCCCKLGAKYSVHPLELLLRTLRVCDGDEPLAASTAVLDVRTKPFVVEDPEPTLPNCSCCSALVALRSHSIRPTSVTVAAASARLTGDTPALIVCVTRSSDEIAKGCFHSFA
jgi:hypothetical protein